MNVDISIELNNIVGQPEGETIEYNTVLPPSRVIGQIISSFANTSGGYLILGVSDSHNKVTVKGLSEDFQAISITKKAIELLTPIPNVEFQYFMHNKVKLFGIKVEKSSEIVSLEQKIYKRSGASNVLENRTEIKFNKNTYVKITLINKVLSDFSLSSTQSKHKLIDTTTLKFE